MVSGVANSSLKSSFAGTIPSTTSAAPRQHGSSVRHLGGTPMRQNAAPAWPAARDVALLLKPRITAMALMVAGATMLLVALLGAADAAAPIGAGLATVTVASLLALAPQGLAALVGIGFAVAGAGALNMVLERDIDMLMERTLDRPLPARRMRTSFALSLGLFLGLSSVPLLWFAANPLTGAIAALSLGLYVLVYTPMKRSSPLALAVGAVPGAAPALMGGTALSGHLDLVSLCMFGIVFFWQLPHFVAISIYREDEYVAAGHRVVAKLYGMGAARAVMVATTAASSLLAVALWPLGIASPVTGVIAVILSAVFVGLALMGYAKPYRVRPAADVWARRVFLASLVWQTVLFGALAVDVVARALLA